jgi:hypothetical protein
MDFPQYYSMSFLPNILPPFAPTNGNSLGEKCVIGMKAEPSMDFMDIVFSSAQLERSPGE